jgi:methanogenic corrinoid protein MtbC1
MTATSQAIARLLSDLKEKETIAAVKNGIERGDDPLLIMDQCQEGIVDVGKRYEKGEYYISALIMAGEIMHEISEILLPALQQQITGRGSGRILLATVQKDIHFIGKNIFKVILQCSGYTVRDAGEDVAPKDILQEAVDFAPDIIGLSCLLTSCYDTMKETVAVLRAGTKNLKPAPLIVIGGRVSAKVSTYVGADGWADDAMIGLRLCNRLILR